MLREQSIYAVLPVLANLGERKLQVVENSPVHQMSVAAYPATIDFDLNNIVGALSKHSDKPNGPVTHEFLLEQYVEKLGSGVVKQAAFARTVVNPICGRIFAKVNDGLTESTMIDLEVVPARLSAAVASVQTAEMTARYSNSNQVSALLLPQGLPEKTEADLIEALKTGSQQYDTLLSEMIAQKPEGWLEKLYNAVFVRQDYNTTLIDGRNVTAFYADLAAADDFLAVWLLATYLKDNPPAGYPLPLTVYEDVIANFIAASATALYHTLARADRLTSNQTLVLKWGKRISVNGPVYDMYLESGGAVEAIFGAALTAANSDNTSMRVLLDSNQELVRAYHSQVSAKRTEASAQAVSLAHSRAIAALTQEINSLTDEQNVCGRSREEMHAAAQELFAGIAPQPFAEKAYANIRSIVCQVMFPGSNANEMLSLIDAELESDPSMDVRVAAYKAVMRLIAKHLVSQVR